MINYDEMSDFEVNKKLAFKVGAVKGGKTDKHYQRACPNYCSNWGDIGPLIDKYDIDVGSTYLGMYKTEDNPKGKVYDAYSPCCIRGRDLNKKRAAAICIIKLIEND